MTVYKVSEDFRNNSRFSGVIFDCDGVLIDASKSYDLALEKSGKLFAKALGLKFDQEEFAKVVEVLRELGTFNNDWDTLAVVVAFLYGKSSDTRILDKIANTKPLAKRLRAFESRLYDEKRSGGSKKISLNQLLDILQSVSEGTRRDEVVQRILVESAKRRRFFKAVTYPEPVGKSFLGTLFDELVYGPKIFKETYGFDCATSRISKPGLVYKERKLVSNAVLSKLFDISDGNIGIITGRPRVPTIYTLGDSYKWFNPDICLFTGDYLLEVEEVKPSAKPMIKVAKLVDSNDPILYVGDSGEDLLMVKNTNSSGRLDKKVYFAAIAESKEKVDFFESQEKLIDCIVSDVNELARVIQRPAVKQSKVSRKWGSNKV